MGIIERTILKSDLGLNPSNDGQIMRLIIPMPTEEHRRELARQVDERVEEARVSVRNIRRAMPWRLARVRKGKADLRRRSAPWA